MESVIPSQNLSTTTTSTDAKDASQFINMKVLRLLKPSFVIAELGAGRPADGPDVCKWKRKQETVDGWDRSFFCDTLSDDNFPLQQQLVLPQCFGAMFLGQNLHCYACISNITTGAVRDITVKLEFQVQSATAARSEMVLNDGKQFTLESQQTYDFVINREVRDLGSHMMVASITFANPSDPSDRINVKKCFRYTVARPMDFKNKFVSLPDGGYFGEFNIQNLTNTTIVLENVKMITSPDYVAKEINTQDSLSPLERVEMRSFLGPNDSYQFVFRIQLTDQSKTGDLLKSSASPGRVQILWRSRMGDLGKVTTSPLSRTIPDLRDIFVTLSQKPARAQLHKAFAVMVGVFSLCTRTMDIVVKLLDPSDRSFAWCGVSGRSVGLLQPGGKLEFSVPVVPCKLGLHLFPRFQLMDRLTGQRYDSEDLAEIFVEQ